MSKMNNLVLSALLFSLLLFVGQHVSLVDAVGGSAEEKERRDSCACLVKEPTSSEESDSKEDCSAFEKLPTTLPPTEASSSSAAPSSSSDSPSSSSDSPSSSSDSPSSSSDSPSSSSDSPSSSSSSSSPGSSACPSCGFKSHCRLKHALVNASFELTITQKIDFDLMIKELEEEVLSNPCGCLTAEMKVVKASKKLKKHFKKHPSHKKKLHYKSIGGWGKWRDFIQVAVDIQGEQSENVTKLDGSDECKLFDAIRNCTGNDTDSDELIVEMRGVLKKNYWKHTQKQAALHRNFHAFFKKRPDLKVKIDDCEIEGFGDVESFREVFKVSHQTTRLKKVISGSSDADCELLFRMTEQANNVSHEIPQRLQLKQLHDVIKAKFEVTIDIQIRLQFVSQQIFECLQLSPWTIELIMDIKLKDDIEPVTPGSGQSDPDCACEDGEWGDVYELSYVSHFCTNANSCGDSNDGEGTEPTGAPTSSTSPAASSSSSDAPSSSSDAPSSSSDAPSSSSAAPSSSSAAPSSSSSAPMACANRPAVIVKNGNSFANASWLEYSIEVVFSGWTLQMRTGYSSTRNRIKNCVNELSGACVGFSPSAKITELISIMISYSVNNHAIRDMELEIPIKGSSSHGFNGKIRDFCNCDGAGV